MNLKGHRGDSSDDLEWSKVFVREGFVWARGILVHVQVFGGEEDPVIFLDGGVLSMLIGIVGKSFLG